MAQQADQVLDMVPGTTPGTCRAQGCVVFREEREMSIELIEYAGGGPHEVSLTQYWGGDEAGTCVQVTGYNCDGMMGCVGLTKKEARIIGEYLVRWAKGKGQIKKKGDRASTECE